jgi:site-specific recombinase XerD
MGAHSFRHGNALLGLRKESGESLVFPNAEGPRGWLVAAVEGAGFENYSWHCNRHTFASRLVMAGVDCTRSENSWDTGQHR